MRVLLVHNFYQRAGGEDQVFRTEHDLLSERGHDVETLTVHNDAVAELSTLQLASRTVWSRSGRQLVEEAARVHRAEVVHFHNTLPLISPAGYLGARAAGAAVVQTLHNYRVVCPSALLFREGRPCDLCVGKAFAAPAIQHACYRGSRAATAAIAVSTATHRALGTWSNAVDRYIALTGFARERFVDGGLPPDKVVVKANSLVHVPDVAEGGGGYALYIGRLDEGKGIDTMLTAWRENADLPPLVLAGDGLLAHHVREAQDQLGDRLRWVGWLEAEAIQSHLAQADLLVFPSESYEGCPITLVEALGVGLPIVGSDLGAVQSMLTHGREARLFPPGDASALADAVRDVWVDSDMRRQMRIDARATFTTTFSPTVTYDALVSIYADAIAQRHAN